MAALCVCIRKYGEPYVLSKYQVFSYIICSSWVSLSGYKSLSRHYLDVWCWASPLTSLYHHLPQVYCDHIVSINSEMMHRQCLLNAGGWGTLINMSCHHDLFYYVQVLLCPWHDVVTRFAGLHRQPYSNVPVLSAFIHSSLHAFSSRPDVPGALLCWSTPTRIVVFISAFCLLILHHKFQV